MQRTRSFTLLFVGLFTAGSSAFADDFPRDLTVWTQTPAKAVFTGTGTETWDKKIRERGWILRDDSGTYHLWYTGYNDEKRTPKTRSLGHATSPDGLNWTRDAANPIHDTSWVEDVSVSKVNGQFWMFAEGENDIAHLLTSTDGKTWAERGPLDIRKADGTPISEGPRGTPAVWYENGVWNLFYERMDQAVWLARSADGNVWTNVSDEPVLKAGPEPYDKAAVAFNQIIKRDGMYYVIYHANAARPAQPWTTCLARSKDLIHWEKYAGNPIIQNNASSGVFVTTPNGLVLYTMHPEVRRYEVRK